MKILLESTDSQTLKIIPRSYADLVDVVITIEDSKEVTTLEDVATISNLGYLEIPSVFDLKEDTFYSFEVWDLDAGEQNETIYKGKIFCTNQTDYSLNDGQYSERTRTNEYKIHGE